MWIKNRCFRLFSKKRMSDIISPRFRADVAQLVEHHHGKVGVTGSIPVIGSRENLLKFVLALSSGSAWPRRTFQYASANARPSPRQAKFVEGFPNLNSRIGQVPKRSNGKDCKSFGSRLRRFESYPAHHRKPSKIIHDCVRVLLSSLTVHLCTPRLVLDPSLS